MFYLYIIFMNDLTWFSLTQLKGPSSYNKLRTIS